MAEDYIRSNLGPAAIAEDLWHTAQVLARFGPRLPTMMETALIQQARMPPARQPLPWRRAALALAMGLGVGVVLGFALSF